mmetsp:Transcript_16877/g.35232  ORF Transcript_16877/g.35232 Transcript_16877/m.35232 type:complete len:339 (-) Transcript_16877:169-1185(-)
MHVLGPAAPVDAPLLEVHVAKDRGDLALHPVGRHPVHVVEERRDGELLALADLQAVLDRAVEELEAALLEVGPHLLVVGLLEVPRAVLLGVVAEDVASVKVVVVDHVGREHILEDDREVVLAVEAELKLLLRHAGEKRARLEAHVVEEPGAEANPRAALIDLLADLLLRGLFDNALTQEAKTANRNDPPEEVVRGPARGARVLEGLDLVLVVVPELGRRVTHERAEGGVARVEERDVVLREDLPELVIREAAARGDLELSEGDLAEVEVNRSDLRVVDDVIESVVTRRRDGDDMVIAVEGEDGLLDARVLPRYVVDILLVKEREHDLVVEEREHPEHR